VFQAKWLSKDFIAAQKYKPGQKPGFVFRRKAQLALIFAWGDGFNQPQLLLGATPLSVVLTA
jgi:hypothetical protein